MATCYSFPLTSLHLPTPHVSTRPWFLTFIRVLQILVYSNCRVSLHPKLLPSSLPSSLFLRVFKSSFARYLDNLAMPLSINDLPPETLRLVLSEVKSDAYKDRSAAFLNALTTCRLWSQIGIELLWTDISLTGYQLVKFTNTSHANSSLIRSLSIRYPLECNEDLRRYSPYTVICDPAPRREKRYTMCQASHALTLLSTNLKTMDNLESFSFVLNHYKGMICDYDFPFTRGEISTILMALPSSVRHLELDTKCSEAEDGHSAPRDLCSVVRGLMNRLCTLRLRMGHLCPNLFACPSPESMDNVVHEHLGRKAKKVIVINTMHPLLESRIMECGRVEKARPLDWGDDAHYDHYKSLFPRLVASAQEAVERKELGELSRLR